MKLLVVAILLLETVPSIGADLGNSSPDTSVFDLEPTPVVLTPTRLKQSLHDVPASVTIIRADTLTTYGITSIPEALRLVPGMEVTQVSGSDYRINYHGTNILEPRRMNVLIDGVSVYEPAFARVDWTQLPVAMIDVDRIEVTRSPDSAVYGPNSMLAVINIITRHPQDVEKGAMSIGGGTQGSADMTARIGATIGDTALRLTASHTENRGYAYLSETNGDHDGYQTNRLNLRSSTTLNNSTTLELTGAVSEGLVQVGLVDPFQTSLPNEFVNDYLVSAVLTKTFDPRHELQINGSYWANNIRQTWSTCPPQALLQPALFNLWQADPAAVNAILTGNVPKSGSESTNILIAQALASMKSLGSAAQIPVCGVANQSLSQERADVELQDTYLLTDSFRLVSGMGFRYQRGDSQTFVGGTVADEIIRVFGNAEYKPSDRLTLNAGAYAENGNLTGFSLLPRIGLNFHLSPAQTLRAAWSEGSRAPDIQEQRANWTYSETTPSNGTARFYQSALSPGGLGSERIKSFEIGYLLTDQPTGFSLDIKAFDDHLFNLISEKLQLSNYQPTNNNSVRLSGLEIQATAQLSPTWSEFVNFSYLDSFDATTPLERTQYSRFSGSLGLGHRFTAGWHAAAAYYASTGNGIDQSAYGRVDVTVAKTFRLQSSTVDTSLTVRRLNSATTTSYVDVNKTATSTFDGRLQLVSQVQVKF